MKKVRFLILTAFLIVTLGLLTVSIAFTQGEEFGVGAVLGVAPPENGVTVSDVGSSNILPGSLVRSWNSSQNDPFFTIFDLDTPDTLPNVAPFPVGGNFIGAGEFVNGLSYMVDDANNVYVVDDTGAIQNQYMATAPPNGEIYSGLALDPADGTVYAVSTNFNTSSLFTFNVNNGNANLVGPIDGVPAMIAIAIDGSGALRGYCILTDSFMQIDPSNGHISNVFPLPFNANQEQGMGYDPATGLLYMLAFNNATSQGELWTVDTSNPAVPVFNFIEVLGVSSPGGVNQLTWAGTDLGVVFNNRVYLPIVLHAG